MYFILSLQIEKVDGVEGSVLRNLEGEEGEQRGREERRREEREKSLLAQWVALTEEQNAVQVGLPLFSY